MMMNSGVSVNPSPTHPDSKVERTSRLWQWRIESFGACPYRRSDPFKIGIWNWYLTVEKSKYMCIRLYPEVCRVTKEQPPIARFIVRVSNSGPNRRSYTTPVHEKMLRTSEDFVWAIDPVFQGRFVIDVEFLDLTISSVIGGEAHSIWENTGTVQSTSNNSSLRYLARMLKEGIHADVTINTSDGVLKAHKSVLASSSPVFESMFLHNLKEKESSIINIEDMPLESCSALLAYIYGSIKQEDFWKHRVALLGAANKYDIADLTRCCEESLLEDISAVNVFERLQEAWLYQLEKLKKGCLTYLVEFGRINDLQDELKAFLRIADRELILEMFQTVLAVWRHS